MCGRFGITDARHIGERFQLYLDLDLSDIRPRYNAAPEPVSCSTNQSRAMVVN